VKIKQLIRHVLKPWHSRQAANALRDLEGRLRTPAARFAIPFIFRGAGFFKSIKPMQSQAEFGELYARITERLPQRIIEIGTCHGGTLYLWCQAAHPKATIISLDLPAGEFGGGYPACRADFYRSFAAPGQTLHLIRADSHSPETVRQIAPLLGDAKADLLFIDGDHTYDGVKRDFELYSPLVAKGGWIALHDILPRADEPRIEVWRFWQELKQLRPVAFELADATPDGRAIGIGVVRAED